MPGVKLSAEGTSPVKQGHGSERCWEAFTTGNVHEAPSMCLSSSMTSRTPRRGRKKSSSWHSSIQSPFARQQITVPLQLGGAKRELIAKSLDQDSAMSGDVSTSKTRGDGFKVRKVDKTRHNSRRKSSIRYNGRSSGLIPAQWSFPLKRPSSRRGDVRS